MIDPEALSSQTIVLVHSQEEWEELQENMHTRGARHHEEKFDKARPYRWIDTNGSGGLEWYKGSKESAFSDAYRAWAHIDFCDLPMLIEVDDHQVSALFDLI